MFCPNCGALLMGLPVDGVLTCTKPQCNDVTIQVDERFNSITEAVHTRLRHCRGVEGPTTDSHVCPHCGGREATTELRQMDQTDEPEVLLNACGGKGWREG